MPEHKLNRGRPSLAAERRQEAIAAFLTLITERGLTAVTLDDVARRAGMQRSVLRHYVGNRDELVQSALDSLIDSYRTSVSSAVGNSPAAEALIDHLFSPAWYRDQSEADRAVDVLFHEAKRSERTRARLRDSYGALIEIVADAIERYFSDRSRDIDPGVTRAKAYSIVCLAEHNVDMMQIGFDSSLAEAARRNALLVLNASTG